MSRGKSTAQSSRAASGLAVAAGILSAAALTGAAFLTVEHTSCGSGAYVRHDSYIQYVGHCVDPSNLPPAHSTSTPQDTGANTYEK